MFTWARVCAKLLQSCLTLCNPVDCSPSGSSVLGILQARVLEWVVLPPSWKSSQPKDLTHSPVLAGGFFTTGTTWEAQIHAWNGVKAEHPEVWGQGRNPVS